MQAQPRNMQTFHLPPDGHDGGPGVAARRLASLLDFAAMLGSQIAVLHLRPGRAVPPRRGAQDRAMQRLQAHVVAAWPGIGLVAPLEDGAILIALEQADGRGDAAIGFVESLPAVLAGPGGADSGRAGPDAVIGMAIWPEDGEGPDDLLRHARSAACLALADGTPWARFRPGEAGDAAARQALREAIAAGAIELSYRATVAETGVIDGYQAMPAWRDPADRLLDEAALWRLAGDAALAMDLLAHLLHAAGERAAGWPAGMSLTLRLPAGLLRMPALAELITGLTREAGLPLRRLVILVDAAAEGEAASTLAPLRAHGLRVLPEASAAAADAPSEEDAPDDLGGFLRLGAQLAQVACVAVIEKLRDRLAVTQVQAGPDAAPIDHATLAMLHAMQGGAEILAVPDTAAATAEMAALARPPAGIRLHIGMRLADPEGRPLGTLCFLDRTPRPAVPAATIETLRVVRQAVANALQLRRAARLRQAEARSGRQEFTEQIARAMAQQRRNGQPFSLLRISLDTPADLDPQAEAAAQLAMPAIIAGCLRKEDVPLRLRDGEFGVLLVAGDGAEAALAADRVRRTLAARLAARGHALTACVGGAFFTTAPGSAAEALGFVEELLGRARRGGADRVLAASYAAGAADPASPAEENALVPGAMAGSPPG